MKRIFLDRIKVEKCDEDSCYFNRDDRCCFNYDNPREIKTKGGKFPRWCPLVKKIYELNMVSCGSCMMRFTDENKFIRCRLTNNHVLCKDKEDFPSDCPLKSGIVILKRS